MAPGRVRPLRGAHRQFVVDLSVFCRRGLGPPLGIAGRSRLLQDCPAGATFPGVVPEKRRPLRGAHRQFVVDLSVFCRRGLGPPLGIAGRSRLLQDCPAGATFPGVVPEKRRPLRGAHRQFVVDLSVFCRRGLGPPLGIAGRSRLLQDCPAGATFPGVVPEKRRPLRGAHRQFVVDLSVFCRRGLGPPLGIAGRSWLLQDCPAGATFPGVGPEKRRPLRGAHRQFVVDLSVFCRRGLGPPLGIAGRSRLLQDCPAGATFPGVVPEKRRPLRGAHRQFVVDLSVFCRRGLGPPLGIAGRSRLLQDCPAGATFPGVGPEKRRPLRGAHRQFVVDLSVFCRRGLGPPLGIAGRSRLLQDCPAGATFPGVGPEKRRS